MSDLVVKGTNAVAHSAGWHKILMVSYIKLIIIKIDYLKYFSEYALGVRLIVF